MATLTAYLSAVMGVSLLGGALPLLREFSEKRLALPLSFSGGVLLGAVFFHMIPQTSAILREGMGWPILAGFLLIFILERFVFVHACGESDCDVHHVGIPAFLGISLHSLLDGVALGASFVLPQLAPVILLAVVIHKMPDGISLSSILLSAGWGRRRIIYLTLIFSLMTPIGTLLAYPFLRSLSPQLVAIAVGISAGTFLAIATSDILPQIHRLDRRNPMTLLFLLAGLAVSWLGRLFEI